MGSLGGGGVGSALRGVEGRGGKWREVLERGEERAGGGGRVGETGNGGVESGGEGRLR